MKLFNKEERLQYLGFDDLWFSIRGILIVSSIASFLFNDMSLDNPTVILIVRWTSCLFFVTLDWLIIRYVLILLRKQFPDFKDDYKRITSLFVAIIIVLLAVNFFGGNFLTMFFAFLGIQSNYGMSLKVFLPVLIIFVMGMAIYEAIYYHIRLKKSIIQEEQAKQVMIQAQLDTLTNQAKPHFLFNSLNTLRDIIDEEAKEDAKQFVDNLSNVYRFITESGNSGLISLEKELKFVRAYIDIQTERFGDNLIVNLNISKDQLAKGVVPMSLQLLIENAIKHNVVSKAKPLVVDVKVINEFLMVSNTIQTKSTQIPSTKIGLKNIQKRYELISDKTITIKNDGEQFIVLLPLLNSSEQKKTNASINH